MKCVDLKWKARWEMLKVGVKRQHSEHPHFDTIYRAMLELEKADRPCLSRDIKRYTSPMTGTERDVWVIVDGEPEPVPKEIEETNRREFPE